MQYAPRSLNTDNCADISWESVMNAQYHFRYLTNIL